jgi:hypothetical protein
MAESNRPGQIQGVRVSASGRTCGTSHRVTLGILHTTGFSLLVIFLGPIIFRPSEDIFFYGPIIFRPSEVILFNGPIIFRPSEVIFFNGPINYFGSNQVRPCGLQDRIHVILFSWSATDVISYPFSHRQPVWGRLSWLWTTP